MSKSNPTTTTCNGNQLFSFDPKTFTSAPRWAYKTTVSTDCNHLGISFGSAETIVYAYSQHASALKVSRIDDSGATPTVQWTYGFAGSPSKTLIGHKAIDATKDVLAITGMSGTNTYLGILVIPTTSPFTPSSTNIYTSLALDSYDLRGLYINSDTSI